MGTDSKRKLFIPSLKSLPLPGLYEDSRHTASRVQDLVNLHLCLAIYPVLLFKVNHHHVIHHWKFIVPFSLGAEANLIAVMLDLRFMPQGCLYLKEGEEEEEKKRGMFFQLYIFHSGFCCSSVNLSFPPLCLPLPPSSKSLKN